MADPKKKRGIDESVYGAGAGVRRALGSELDRQTEIGKRALLVGAAPIAVPAAVGSQFVRGLAGAPERPSAAVPTSAAAAPAPAVQAPAAPRRALPAQQAPQAVATTAAPVAAAPVRQLNPGDVNTFTGSDRVTHSAPLAAFNNAAPAAGVAPMAARRLDPVVASRNNVAAVQDATTRSLGGVIGAARSARQDATELLNPMSAGGELMRRFEISQGGFQGSPSARRMAGEAILGQLGAQNAASATGQAGANQVLLQGAQGEGVANEAFARRRLEAGQFNVSAQQATDELAAERAKPSQVIRGLDGMTNVLRQDGTATTLRDETGDAIQTADPAAKTGTVSAETQYKALSDQLAALQSGFRPAGNDEAALAYDQRVAELEGQMKALTGSGTTANGTAGMTLVGRKNGKAIYRDAAGNLHIDE